MMGFAAKGRPEFANHEAHDDPQGIGFAHRGQLRAHDHAPEDDADNRVSCTSLRTSVRGQDRPGMLRLAYSKTMTRTNDVPLEAH
jgi:hypothetical protein